MTVDPSELARPAEFSRAWRNLIRVLTHEIMNTLTPIASLGETAVAIADEGAARAELKEALTTIVRRSHGLIGFVERYREVMQVPTPQMQTVAVAAALDGIVRLMQEELADVNVDLSVVPRSLEVQADPVLLDQVLVNLVRNAVQAMRESPTKTLRLRGKLEYGRTLVQVADSGCGIAEGVIEQIFVPFFTTRRDGSGIGLSVSRQIMMAHGGQLVASSNDEGTTMSLLF